MTIAIALSVEWLLGDPKSRWHPVAVFGRLASLIEARLYGDGCAAGALAWCVALALPAALVHAVLALARELNPGFELLLGAAAVWATLGWRSLVEHVDEVRLAPDLPTARTRVSRIVGRDVGDMDAGDARRAAMESLAENASDGVVAPLFWACVGGPVGAVAYRIVNTLDAMWGHRNARFTRFGCAAARADDVANWLPARLCAAACLCVARCRPTMRLAHDTRSHPSVNAGWPESAMAHALGVRLGGPVRRGGCVEERPWMGPPGAPDPSEADFERALRLTNRTLLLSGGLALVVESTWA